MIFITTFFYLCYWFIINNNAMKQIATSLIAILFCLLASASKHIDDPNFQKTKTFTIPCTKSISEISYALSSISTLKGIQYYSNTRKRWETLYKEAGFIVSPHDKRFIADNHLATQKQNTCYCLLDDNSLGECVFKITYTKTNTEITADFVLMEPISVWGIEGVQANNLHIQLKANKTHPEAQSIQAIVSIEARYREISFIESTLTKSLDARLDALYRWMTKQIGN